MRRARLIIAAVDERAIVKRFMGSHVVIRVGETIDFVACRGEDGPEVGAGPPWVTSELRLPAVKSGWIVSVKHVAIPRAVTFGFRCSGVFLPAAALPVMSVRQVRSELALFYTDQLK